MKTILTFTFVVLSYVGWGQDYHHWAEHFGARASLLGGAATAGLGDNGTVYYNPAAMAFVEDPSMSISVNAYRMRMLKMRNFLGDGIDLKANQFSTMPNLIAGIVDFKKKKRLRLGYAVITRRNYSSKFDYLHQAQYDILGSPTKENFVASYNMHHQLNEYWAGFGISYQLSKGFSIGFSHFGSYRDVKYSNSIAAHVLPNDSVTASITSVATSTSFNYWNIKGVFKPSIALSVENFKFGMSFTTPSFNILGRASAYRDFSAINIYSEGAGVVDLTFIDRADGIRAVHKENGALAIGVSWRLGKKAWLHFTNETFFGGKYYLIFDADQAPSIFPGTITDSLTKVIFGDQNFLSLGEETEARTNIGIGFEAQITKRWELYLGARTDFLYNEQPYYLIQRTAVEASKWNIYHFSLGLVNLTKKNKKYTVGIEYGWTPQTEMYHLIDFTTPTLGNALLGEADRHAYASQHSFKLLMEITILGGKEKEPVN
jgi:hypothetical protein